MCQTCYERGYKDFPHFVGSVEHADDYKRGFEDRQKETHEDAEELYETDFCKKCFDRGIYDSVAGVWTPPTKGVRGHFDSYSEGYYSKASSVNSTDELENQTKKSDIQRNEILQKSKKIQEYQNNSGSNSDLVTVLGKIVGAIAIIAAVAWLAIKVMLPLIFINLAIVSLICAFSFRNWRMQFHILAFLGLILIVLDNNYGWFTTILTENASIFSSIIPYFFYLNVIGGLISVYFFTRDFLNRKSPPLNMRELSSRNLIIMSYLGIAGCLLIFGFKSPLANKASDSRFRVLTNSLEIAIRKVRLTIDNNVSNFEATKLKNEPERAKPVYAKAQKVKQSVYDLDTYINDLKAELYKEAGGFDQETRSARKGADANIPYHVLIANGKALDLKNKINYSKDQMLSVLSDKEKMYINLPLKAEDEKGGKDYTWEDENFGNNISFDAAITTLTRIQSDLICSEDELIKRILGEINKAEANFDRLDAVAVAPSSYVHIGQVYQAEVFLTASDSRSKPEIIVDGKILPTVDGKGLYSILSKEEGEFKWTGTIHIKQSDGTMKEYKTKEQMYTVVK